MKSSLYHMLNRIIKDVNFRAVPQLYVARNMWRDAIQFLSLLPVRGTIVIVVLKNE